MTTPNLTHTPETGAEKATAILGGNPFFGPQAKHLSQAHDQILNETQKFSAAWLKRRQEAAQSTLRFVSQITTGGQAQPAVMMEAMTQWHLNAVERLTQDGKDCTEMLTRCAESLVNHEIEAAEEMADTAKKLKPGRHAMPV